MAFKVSTGLRNHLLATGSFKNAMDGGFLKLYAGTEPAAANDSLGGATLLCTISVSGAGTGLTWEATPVNGVISKAAAEAWQGVNAASGTASFFRFVKSADTGALSTTDLRFQGSVGLVGADLNLSSVVLAASAIQTINHFNVALPTL